MSPAIIIAAIAGASLGVTLIVLLIRGIFQLGKLFNKVENLENRFQGLENRFQGLENRFESLENRFDTLIATVNELRLEVQQTNRILVGLANHTHDADGRTVFTIPS